MAERRDETDRMRSRSGSERRARLHQVCVRLTDAEMAELQTEASLSRRSRSAVLREAFVEQVRPRHMTDGCQFEHSPGSNPDCDYAEPPTPTIARWLR